MLFRMPYILSLIFANNLDDTIVQSRARRMAELSDAASDSSSVESDESLNDGLQKNINKNYDRNININAGRDKHRKQGKKKGPGEMELTGERELNGMKEIQSANCASNRRNNLRYSSSFIGNISGNGLSVDKDFDEVIGNNSKAKTTSTVHEGEDMTLCWIELTTIKEDKNVQPPNRLVIREYTISFENSATIPDRYLECKRLEGELMVNDPDIGKTALFEVIDEETKVSKVVNFTSVSHVGDILVWQHKKVKCGVGPVVTKNIQWNDNSDNPTKRVEIKVSPKIHQLTAMKPEEETEEEPCTDSTEKAEEDSTNVDNITESCENDESGSCEVTMTSDEISTESRQPNTTEETVTEIAKNEESSESETTKSEESSKSEDLELPIVSKLSTSSSEETSTQATISPNMPDVILKKKKKQEEFISKPFLEESSTEATTEETLTSDSDERKSSAELSNEGEETSGSVTEEITSTTDVSMESSESIPPMKDSGTYPESTHYSSVIPLETMITTSRSDQVTEIQEEEASGDSSIESTSETSKDVASDDNGDVTTATPLFGFTEFANESKGTGKILDKLGSSESTSSEIKEATTIEEEESFLPVSTTINSLETISGESENLCENSEDCSNISSSEFCDESGNCGTATTTPCESELCSEESVQDHSEKIEMTETEHTTVINVITTLTSREAENNFTMDSSIPTTMETRRSTIAPRHKLTLKVRILLEHVDENKQKHNLVEVEKHLSLDENLHQGHPDLLKELKSLNESVNMETISTLLNCTSLGNLTRDINLISKEGNYDKNILNSDDSARLEFTNSGIDDSILHQSSSEEIHDTYEDSQYSGIESTQEHKSRRRRSLEKVLDSKVDDLKKVETVRHDLFDDFDNSSVTELSQLTDQDANLTKQETTQPTTTMTNDLEMKMNDTVDMEKAENITKENDESTAFLEKENVNNETKMEIVRQTLPGIQEDVSVGLQNVISQLAQSNLTSLNDIQGTTAIDLLDIIVDPKDNRVHSRKTREVGEEVGHWSNERIKAAPLGGNFRSFTEFTLYRVPF